MVFEIVVYAGLISAMPRAGGDYVWLTRIFHSSIGFIVAAVGWWFILWLWTPIYADMGVQTTVKPIFRILGLNGAADLLEQAGRHLRRLAGRHRHRLDPRRGRHEDLREAAEVLHVHRSCGYRGARHPARGQLSAELQGEVQQRGGQVLRRHRAGRQPQGEQPRPDQVQDRRERPASRPTPTAPTSRTASTPPAREAIEAIGSGTGMPTSTFAGTFKGTLWLIPLMLFWMAWPNWGATLYGEVRGAKDFRKNIYQMARWPLRCRRPSSSSSCS